MFFIKMWSVDIDAVTCVHNLQYRFSTCEHWNQLPDSFRQPRPTPVMSQLTFSFTCQLISITIITLIMHHSFTLSLQAQNLPFQQILSYRIVSDKTRREILLLYFVGIFDFYCKTAFPGVFCFVCGSNFRFLSNRVSLCCKN